jgi:hypothetical protein
MKKITKQERKVVVRYVKPDELMRFAREGWRGYLWLEKKGPEYTKPLKISVMEG